MIKQTRKNLTYYQFHCFPHNVIDHGLFTRLGGVSPSPYGSLNVGGTTGDTKENIVENRKRMFAVFERKVDTIYDSWQVHGNRVVYVTAPRPLNGKHEPADIIITDSPRITLFMRFADCVPILLFDEKKKIIALVHSGWQGTVSRAVQKGLKFMFDELGSKPENIFAGIGPSIGPDHYEVGENVCEEVEKSLIEFKSKILISHQKTYFLDLWLANKLLIEQAGITKIEMANLCTICNLDEWFSYRAEGKKSGRFGVLMGLR
jgi:YfiH family protein